MNQRNGNFYGKYRGDVVKNQDPLRLGRIMVSVPGVCKDVWALPCTPFAGAGVAFSVTPPVRAAVWVEFEGGDPGKPIVVGYYWDRPMPPTLSTAIEIAPGEIKLCCDDNTITLSSKGIEIASGAVSIKIDSAKISAKCGVATLDIAKAGIDVAAGKSTTASFSSAQAKVSSNVVIINDGALQVI